MFLVKTANHVTDGVTPIGDITPLSLLDYPRELSAIFWFLGCDLRCAYCYNPHFVEPEFFPEKCLSMNDLSLFLSERSSFIDAVVLSGGECTLHDSIIEIAQLIKSFNLKIKIDTNGGHPERLQTLILLGLVDFIALDFKAPKEKFHLFTNDDSFFSKWEKSFDLIQKSGITFEVRTTFHRDLLSEDDLKKMSDFLIEKGYVHQYFVQNFFSHAPTLRPLSISIEPLRHTSLPIIIR